MSDQVIRTFRTNKKETFYKTLNTEFFFVPTLSLEAKGLLGLCLARPDNWNIYFAETQRHSSNGETSHRSAWKDLERHGYFHRNKSRNAEGKFVHEYNVYEHPSLNPHFAGYVPEIKKRTQPDLKIKSGWESVTIQTPEPTLENPQVETHARISTPGNPDVENHALLNKEQPIKDELSTNQPKIEEPNTEEEKKESPSSEVTFANVHKKITELLASKKIRYNDRAPKETSAITWFMLYGYEPAFVFETMTKLLLIKDTPPFKDDVKFWKPMPITIASLKSYVDQIHSTAESLVETPTQRYAREAEEHRQKNPDPKDFEYFEDWVLAYNLPRGSKTEILKFDSPEEIFDPTTTKEKAGLAKRFYDEFKTAKGGTCKFKRTVAA